MAGKKMIKDVWAKAEITLLKKPSTPGLTFSIGQTPTETDTWTWGRLKGFDFAE